MTFGGNILLNFVNYFSRNILVPVDDNGKTNFLWLGEGTTCVINGAFGSLGKKTSY